jgi:predicted ATPase/DNA-binding CsgD family transcriptional regulator
VGGASPAAARFAATAGNGWPPGLPAPLTRFVGRERERAEVARLVAANRLVTLVGAGGVGKTRLAIEVAAELAASFADGTDLIDLSAVTDPALLPSAVARGLGLEERAGTGLEERMLRVLRGQHRLLVVDNCEHLRPACADLVTMVLGSCPGVVALATSRQSLQVPGELTWRVPSLTFPWPELSSAVTDMEGFEAVALFLARARASCPGLRVGPAEVAAVTSICFVLDGIPLALELAGARAGAMSLREIAERLTGCFELLGRSGIGPARHQTLRASVEWSHQLLSEHERVLFRRLAVFVGGWSLEAAEAVCALPPLSRDQIAGLLAALVDKSLVQVGQTLAGSQYRLLEVIRAYAGERLAESGDAGQARAQHGAYYVKLGEQAGSEMLGPGLEAWAQRLDHETGNLRAASSWCAEDPGRAGLGLCLAAGLWNYWHPRGQLREAAAWLQDALGRGGPERARAAALSALGLIASFQGEQERAIDLLTASIECAQRCGYQHGQGRALTHLSQAQALSGDARGAADSCERALAIARQADDAWVEGSALFRFGIVKALTGDIATAKSLAAASIGVFPRTGDRRLRGYGQIVFADCLTREGNAAEAIEVLRDALAFFEALPERWALLRAASLLAEACGALGDWPRTAILLGVVDALSDRTGGRPFTHTQDGLNALRARARDQLGPALDTAAQAGRLLGRGDQISTALWPSTGRERGQAATSGLPLTTREREIAELIAHGLTNKQIAARLVIAERTVDTHVGRILAKLGCASRAQVAAIVTATTAAATAATLPAGLGGPAAG